MEKIKSQYLTFFIFLESFLLGICIYFISLVSVVKLIGQISLSIYPLLIFSQGIILLFTSGMINFLASKNERLFHQCPFILGIITILLSLIKVNSSSLDLILTALIFFTSMISVMWMEISMNHLNTTKTSILLNPKVGIDLSIIHEISIVFISILGIKYNFSSMQNLDKILLFLPPIIISQIIIFLLLKLPHKNTMSQENVKFTLKDLNKEYPFIFLLISLFTIILVAKNLHAFAQMLGMKELSSQKNTTITKVFSQLSIIQSILILSFLFMARFFGEKTSSWVKSFKIFISGQFILIFLMGIFSHPLILIGAGAIRKLLHRSILNNSSTLLYSSIPSFHRLYITNITQNYSTIISYFFVSIFSFLHLNFNVPVSWMFLTISFGIIYGLKLISKLLHELNSFNVKFITRFHKTKVNINDAVNACLSLSNSEAASHFAALSILLWWKPRPTLTKAIIYSLGKMQVEENIRTLFDCYNKFDTENIQKQTILALSEYNKQNKYPQIEIFFLAQLKMIVLETNDSTEIKQSLACCIIHQIPDKSFHLLLRELKSNNISNKKISNILTVFYCFSKSKHQKYIPQIISGFLQYPFSVSIQLSAIYSLFAFKKYKRKSIENLESIIEKAHPSNYIQICKLLTQLNITNFKKFISSIDNSADEKYKIDLLICKMCQGYSSKEMSILNKDFSDELFDPFGVIKMNAIRYIKKFHRITNNAVRYQFYSFIINNYSSRIEKLLEILSLSDCDFDQDRLVITKQATDSGHKLVDDFQLFRKTQKSSPK